MRNFGTFFLLLWIPSLVMQFLSCTTYTDQPAQQQRGEALDRLFCEETNQNKSNIEKYLEGLNIDVRYDDSTGAFYYANQLVVNINDRTALDEIREKYGNPIDSLICPCEDSLILWQYEPSDSIRVEEIVKSTSEQRPEAADFNYLLYSTLTDHYDIESGRVGGSNGADPITIAILDTGLDSTRQEEYPMWISASREQSTDDCDLAGATGWNFVGNNADINDDHGHGTLVADDVVETIEELAKVEAMQGGYELMILKVLDQHGLGNSFRGLCALKFAIQKGADVVNISWGSTHDVALDVRYDPLYATICEANRLFVASKGNDGTKTFNHVISDYPLPNLLAIGGDNRIDFLNPATSLFGASNQHPHLLTAPHKRDSFSGTSFSAAKVSGLASYLMDKHQKKDPGFIIMKIHELTKPVYGSASDCPFKYISLPQ